MSKADKSTLSTARGQVNTYDASYRVPESEKLKKRDTCASDRQNCALVSIGRSAWGCKSAPPRGEPTLFDLPNRCPCRSVRPAGYVMRIVTRPAQHNKLMRAEKPPYSTVRNNNTYTLTAFRMLCSFRLDF